MSIKANDEAMDRAIRSLKSLEVGMTDAARRHLALRCRETRPSRWAALAFRLSGLPAFRLPVAVGAMAVVLAVGVTALMIAHQSPSDVASYGGSTVRLVKVVPAAEGAVTLEWRDGSQRTYTVLKSTNPRDFRGAETHAVRGTRWTDTAPSQGQVVYYRVE